jgi:cell division protein ZapA (FtsZ GTPase activity inhibitor)
MTIKKNTVRVTILGDEYTLRSGTTPEETQAVAQQVDRSIREILDSGMVLETHKAAIMACLRMAGELMEAQRRAAQVTSGLQALSQEVRPWLPPTKRHD